MNVPTLLVVHFSEPLCSVIVFCHISLDVYDSDIDGYCFCIFDLHFYCNLLHIFNKT